MNSFKTKLQQQYEHHSSAYNQRMETGSVEIWIDPDNGDYWGNMLPMEPLKAPFEALEKQRILTLGDGKGGKEAVFFKKLGHEVTATDVAVPVLAHVKELGLIDEYLNIDAESIDLPDESFDFVITKETLHHLPRPYLAIYEMLRVANKGIVFVEPARPCSERKQPPADYEESGNFVYRFNTYELTQIARSYGIYDVAYGYGRMFHRSGSGDIRGVELQKIKDELTAQHAEWDNEFGKEYQSMIICIMMKQPIEQAFKNKLLASGFDCFDIKR